MGVIQKQTTEPAAPVPDFSGLQHALDRILSQLQQMNDRENQRELARRREESPEGELVPENLLNMVTPHATVALAAGVSVLVMPAKPGRICARICNNGVNPVYLSGTNPAVAGEGVLLAPNGTWTFGRKTDDDYRGAVYAISAAGSSLSFQEQ